MTQSERDSQGPPPRIRELVSKTILSGDSAAAEVNFRQTGRLRIDGDSPWMRFSARQSMSSTMCRFDWRARTGPGGVISVRDAFDGKTGRGAVNLLGFIPLARSKPDAQLNRGELLRYLAELPWAPMAMSHNAALSWRDEGDVVVVGAGSDNTKAEIAFTFDAEGRIAEAFAKERPRATRKGFIDTPWRGRFSNYAECDGVVIPRSATVSWLVKDVETPVWMGRITHWRRVSA